MKLSIIIDEEKQEEIIVYAHKENELTRKIRLLAEGETGELMGYKGDDIFRLEAEDICCFVSENGSVSAVTVNGHYKVKQRLYKLEENLDGFIKINQSCLANVSKIEKFEASTFGALTVVFKGGYKDYVSRRNLKNIKERFGI